MLSCMNSLHICDLNPLSDISFAYTHTRILNGILLSDKNEILPLVTIWMNLEGEISQRMANTTRHHLHMKSKRLGK